MPSHKRNLRKIPAHIIEKANAIPGDELSVGCTLQMSQDDIAAGRYSHLNFTLENGNLLVPDEILPPPERGRYSRWNLHGRWLVHRDRPKVPKEFEMEAQSGAGPGTHTIYYTRFVFPRTFRPPSELVLKPQVIGKSDTANPVWTVAVLVSDTVNKSDARFHEQLLFCLNLVQENVGTATVFTKHPAASELSKSRSVDWELLPEGIRQDLLLAKVLPHDVRKRSEVAQRFEARRQLLQSMQPKRWVVGTSGFRRYFGAQFQDDLVALENVEYGNALYVLKGPWEELSKLSRVELWGKSNNVARVVHTPGWEDRALAVIGRLKSDTGPTLHFGE
jgi:hypothetical protein